MHKIVDEPELLSMKHELHRVDTGTVTSILGYLPITRDGRLRITSRFLSGTNEKV